MSELIPSALGDSGYVPVKKIFPREGIDLNQENMIFLALRCDNLSLLKTRQYTEVYKQLRVIKVAGASEEERQAMLKELGIYKHNWDSKTTSPRLRDHLINIFDEDSNDEWRQKRWIVMETVYPSMSLSDLVTCAESSKQPIPEPLIAYIFLELVETLADLNENWRDPKYDPAEKKEGEKDKKDGFAHGDLHFKNILLSIPFQDDTFTFPGLRIIDFARATGLPHLRRKERADVLTKVLQKLMCLNTGCGDRKHRGRKDCKHSKEWIAFWTDLYEWNKQSNLPEWHVMLKKYQKWLMQVRDKVSDEEQQKIKELLSEALNKSGMLITENDLDVVVKEMEKAAAGVATRAAEALKG